MTANERQKVQRERKLWWLYERETADWSFTTAQKTCKRVRCAIARNKSRSSFCIRSQPGHLSISIRSLFLRFDDDGLDFAAAIKAHYMKLWVSESTSSTMETRSQYTFLQTALIRHFPFRRSDHQLEYGHRERYTSHAVSEIMTQTRQEGADEDLQPLPRLGRNQ